MGGRRYEDFKNRSGWEQLKKNSWTRLKLAEPIVRKHKIKLAVENHKDWQIPDLLEFVHGLASEYIGGQVGTSDVAEMQITVRIGPSNKNSNFSRQFALSIEFIGLHVFGILLV